MACLVLRQEASWVMRTTVLNPFPRRFFFRWAGRTPPRTMAPKPARARTWTWNFWPPRHPAGGNVRGAAVGRPPTGRPASPGAATGWAIPPDPQQARGGEIPVQGGP